MVMELTFAQRTSAVAVILFTGLAEMAAIGSLSTLGRYSIVSLSNSIKELKSAIPSRFKRLLSVLISNHLN